MKKLRQYMLNKTNFSSIMIENIICESKKLAKELKDEKISFERLNIIDLEKDLMEVENFISNYEEEEKKMKKSRIYYILQKCKDDVYNSYVCKLNYYEKQELENNYNCKCFATTKNRYIVELMK